MKPYQQRVVNEKAELDDRLGKLKTFLETEVFSDLDNDERKRLQLQFLAMNTYSQILGERIAHFK